MWVDTCVCMRACVCVCVCVSVCATYGGYVYIADLSTKNTSAAKSSVSHSETDSESGEGSTASGQHIRTDSDTTEKLDTSTVSLGPQTLSLPPLPAPPISAPAPPSSGQVPYPSMLPRDRTAPRLPAITTAVRPVNQGLSLEERLSLHQAWVGGSKPHVTEKREGAGVSVCSVPHGARPQQEGSKQGGGVGYTYFSYYEQPVPEEGAGQQTQRCLRDESLVSVGRF